MILAKENAALSVFLEAAPPVAPSPPSPDPRAARLAKFKREQLIVDYLNRGVSVAEIAARVGVGEKRMRAIIRETLARRMPHPPEPPDPSPGVVAIQVSRLNEALLVAFSAMTGTNLKAVDQVVKIVRELDRYGGAFAAEWRRPEASPRITVRGLDTPVEGAAAFGAAWVCGAELAPQAGELNLAADDRPEYSAQRLENIESAPGNPLTPPKRGEGWGEGRGRLTAVGARPQNPAQRLENIESAPGKDWLDDAGFGSLPSPLVSYPIGPGRFPTTLNDVRAC